MSCGWFHLSRHDDLADGGGRSSDEVHTRRKSTDVGRTGLKRRHPAACNIKKLVGGMALPVCLHRQQQSAANILWYNFSNNLANNASYNATCSCSRSSLFSCRRTCRCSSRYFGRHFLTNNERYFARHNRAFGARHLFSDSWLLVLGRWSLTPNPQPAFLDSSRRSHSIPN